MKTLTQKMGQRSIFKKHSSTIKMSNYFNQGNIYFSREYIKRKSPENISVIGTLYKRRRLPTLPHCIAVPSAQAGLTSLFGMERGETPPQ